MAPADDSRPDPTAAAPSPAVRATPGLRAKLTENPVRTILGTAAVGLLFFTLTGLQNSINDLEDDVDAGFAEQGAKIDEINLKLTALIAALNATAEVEAALEGKFLAPSAGDAEPGTPVPG